VNTVQDVVEQLRAGRMIVLVDDEQRENEGDLVCAAQFATPELINFMLREGRGMLCAALAASICDRLEIGPQAGVNTSQRSTAYTVTVDAHERYGVTTGVSASDRATTLRQLADPRALPTDFARPGHVQPLRARAGGVLVRTGQTEGSVDLCRLAGLQPAAVIIEVMNDDGTMARRPDLERLCERHGLKMCSVADVIQHRLERDLLVHRVEEASLETAEGQFKLIAYDSEVDVLPHVALVLGDVGRRDAQGQPIDLDDPVLVRMHSQNLLGDVFADLRQPSARALRYAMRRIQAEGRGAIVYLRHERMGAGLLRRLQTARASSTPRDAGESGSTHPTEAPAHDRFDDRPHIGSGHTTPGIRPPTDKRDYGIGSQILRDLGIRRMKLITNHPFTPTSLSGFGLSIDGFEPIDDSAESAG